MNKFQIAAISLRAMNIIIFPSSLHPIVAIYFSRFSACFAEAYCLSSSFRLASQLLQVVRFGFEYPDMFPYCCRCTFDIICG